MTRVVLDYLIPFLFPTGLYLVWVWYRGRYAQSHGGEVPRIETGPWPQLLFVGAVLAFLSLAATTLGHSNGPGSVYTPSHLEGGKLVPAHTDVGLPASGKQP